MVKIVPAILTKDLKEINDKLAKGEGIVDRIQIDIIDGQFVNNKTVEPSSLENIETNLKLDFHLMTKNPIDWVEGCIRGMADRIIGQIEKMDSQIDFIGKVQEVGASVGLAIDINTPVSALDPVIIEDLDVILVMAVPAGFGGQKFDPQSLTKIQELNEIRTRDNCRFLLAVDGGETPETVHQVAAAGADEIVIGNRLFNGNLKENIDQLLAAI